MADIYDPTVSATVGEYTYTLSCNSPKYEWFDVNTGMWGASETPVRTTNVSLLSTGSFRVNEIVSVDAEVGWAGSFRWGSNGTNNHSIDYVNFFDMALNNHTISVDGIVLHYNASTATVQIQNKTGSAITNFSYNLNYVVTGQGRFIEATPVDKTQSTYSAPDILSYTESGHTYYTEGVFYSNCINLVNAPQLPESNHLKMISFSGCSSLESAAIPQSIIYMNSCFSRCVSLLHSPTLPEGVLYIDSCYQGCTSLLSPPQIPHGVLSMGYAFKDCSLIDEYPTLPNGVINIDSYFAKGASHTPSNQRVVIPSSVKNMRACFDNNDVISGHVYIYTNAPYNVYSSFHNTTQPIILHSMNENVDVCQQLASTANNGNVYVNIRPETLISFTDTQMNYMTNEGLKTLSLQTNANLIQCEIPDLVNGGTITTNVNDALIDLCNRNPISYTPVFEGTVTKSGVTFTNNGDGSFTVNGTAPTGEKVSQSILNIDVFPPAQYKMTGGYKQKDSEVSWRTGTYVTWKSAGGWGFSDSAQESATSFKLNVVSVNIRFEISAGQTVNNVTFTPVITKVGGA